MTPRYTYAIAWIAENDEPLTTDPEEISSFISVLLIADLFGKEPAKVARDVANYRTGSPTVRFGAAVRRSKETDRRRLFDAALDR